MSERTVTMFPGGIEYFEVNGEEYEACARCGSSVGWLDCSDCGGEGGHMGDEISSAYDFGWIDDDEWYPCARCRGKGGTLYCISDREWCLTHPRPGRENVPSSALDPRAWED